MTWLSEYLYSFFIFTKLFLFFSIEGEYVPLPGDQVQYKLCPIPPKFEKNQAIHVNIINFTPEVHLKWDCPNGDGH